MLAGGVIQPGANPGRSWTSWSRRSRCRAAPSGLTTDRLVSRLRSRSPEARAGRLARSLGASERHLLRRCEAAAGYGPKALARILRLQRFPAHARQGWLSLAELGAAAGYSDQPHRSPGVPGAHRVDAFDPPGEAEPGGGSREAASRQAVRFVQDPAPAVWQTCSMRYLSEAELGRAEQFIWLNGRLIDRLRFAHQFRGGTAGRVAEALGAYQNPDGGFGHGIEPDLRGTSSQPMGTHSAVSILDEAGALSESRAERICGFLASITAPDGGVPFVLPSARSEPRAPWWETPDDPPGSLLATAALAGLLHRGNVHHSWLKDATDFCLARIEGLEETNPYEAEFALTFLDHVPERERAETAFERLGALIVAGGHVALDPGAPGEVHWPTDYAPTPGSLGRRLFDEPLMDTHLDALAGRQQPDGGWTVNWQIWTPITGHEWRAWATVRALMTLRAHGRLVLAS